MKRHAASAVLAPRRSAAALSGRTAPPALAVHNGTLEALKWIALALMTLDHVNKFLFDEKLTPLFYAGRLVMPMFGFVLAYNLARPSALAGGMHLRVMKRLAIFGALSTPMFVALVGWWPLNILFMLIFATAILFLHEKGGPWNRVAALALFVFGGALVEFWWPALLSCIAAWAYCRQPSMKRLALWTLATASLFVVNGNLWALVALPILLGAAHLKVNVPRLRWVFYAYYPMHLLVLLVMQRGL